MEWCNFYHVWIDEVDEVLDSGAFECCGYDCQECEHKEDIEPNK